MKIKICGLTKTEEALYLNEQKADYAGFVLFFPKSRRNLSLEKAKPILSALSYEIRRVAVTVSPTLSQVQEIEAAGFDILQVHGTLSQELLEKTTIPVWRALQADELGTLNSGINTHERIQGYVFDAQEPGSGKTFDWNTLLALPKIGKLMILAGGLTDENVHRAISMLHPDVVDVSSSVEYTFENPSDPRKGKDPERIRSFCEAVRAET